MQAGGATDEYMVRAGELNASFIGISFGYNKADGTTVYGRVAAVLIERGQTTIALAGVPAGHKLAELVVNDSEPIFFSHSGSLQQIELMVADLVKQGR